MDRNDQQIEFSKIVEYWINSANRDYKTMINLFDAKDYHWSLFIGHLVIEKLIKAYYMKTNRMHPPFVHDLLRLAKLAGLELNELKSDYLDTITTFNLSARYDSY